MGKHQRSNRLGHIMVIITCLLLSIIPISLSVPHYGHYRPLIPFYPYHPIWFNKPSLVKPLVEGTYLLKQHPYDGLENVLAAYNISENAIKIIRDQQMCWRLAVMVMESSLLPGL